MKKRLFLIGIIFLLILVLFRLDSKGASLPINMKQADSFQLSEAYVFNDSVALVGNKTDLEGSVFFYKGNRLINVEKDYVEGVQSFDTVSSMIHDGFYLTGVDGVEPKWKQVSLATGKVTEVNKQTEVNKVVTALSAQYNLDFNGDTTTLYLSDIKEVGNWLSFWIVDSRNEEDVKSYQGYYHLPTNKVIESTDFVTNEFESKGGILYVFSQNVEEESFFSYTVNKYDTTGNLTTSFSLQLDDFFLFDVIDIGKNEGTILLSNNSSDEYALLTKSGSSYTMVKKTATIVDWAKENNGTQWAITEEDGRRYVSFLVKDQLVKYYEVLPTMDKLYIYDKNNLVVAEQYGENVTRIAKGVYSPLTFTYDEYSNILYRVYQNRVGWQKWSMNSEISGITSTSQPVYGIILEMPGLPDGTTIRYRVYSSKSKWQSWRVGGGTAGVISTRMPLEAIQIRLQGAPSNYQVQYQVYSRAYGWQSWKVNGQTAGQNGKPFQSIRVRIVKR